ncbi:MAG: cysteine desulfurase [Ruminococcus flavefaciens]|nr:cysteine desulfurase [Ruminococcus flavefaciens]
MIYFDNAATTPLDGAVLEGMLPFLKDNFGNTQSQHAYGRAAADALLGARDGTAALLGCKAEELYFLSGGTEANNTILKGACFAHMRGANGDTGHIIVSAIEHPSIIESAKDMQKLGVGVTFLNPDGDGVISPQAVEGAIKENTFFCAVMSANNETGVIQPVRDIGAVCKSRGVFYFCDCVQSAGTQNIRADFCDALSVSAHKFYGPKGAGALYIKKGSDVSRLISGGMQERGLRGGTVNTAGAVGLFIALERAYSGAEENSKKLKSLRDYFTVRVLKEIKGTHLNGGGGILPSHANISFDGCTGENILFALDLRGVAVSTGSACSAGAVSPSHVLSAMGLSADRVKSAVRFSFGKYNTREEVDLAAEYLKETVGKIRG